MGTQCDTDIETAERNTFEQLINMGQIRFFRAQEFAPCWVLKTGLTLQPVVPIGERSVADSTLHVTPFRIRPPSFFWVAGRDVSVRRETELILASASPRKPRLMIASKSSKP